MVMMMNQVRQQSDDKHDFIWCMLVTILEALCTLCHLILELLYEKDAIFILTYKLEN